MTTLTNWIGADGTVIALDGTQSVSVQRGVSGLDAPPVSNTRDQRVNGDGATLVRTRYTERQILLPLLFDPNVITMGEITRGFQGPGTLIASSGRELHDVIYDGGLDAAWTVERGGVEGQTFRKANIDLIALDPWWYGPLVALSGTFGAATPWNAAIPWNSAIPWNGGASQAVTVTGDAPAIPTIILVGAATTASMSVSGVGGWETAQPIPSGGYLTVNSGAARRGPHRGPHGLFAEADGPTDWSLLTEGSQLFDLPVGSSSLVFGATGTDASTAWHAFYSPRYLTP